MGFAAIQLVPRLRRGWPNSPILAKELRGASRRGCLYGLRGNFEGPPSRAEFDNVLASFVVYAIPGGLLLWRAGRRFRRNPCG